MHGTRVNRPAVDHVSWLLGWLFVCWERVREAREVGSCPSTGDSVTG